MIPVLSVHPFLVFDTIIVTDIDIIIVFYKIINEEQLLKHWQFIIILIK